MSHEELENKKLSQASFGDALNPDADLHSKESWLTDFTRLVTNSDRLIHIYTLSGIIIATVIITLCRSFFFFSVSIFQPF